MSFLIATNLRLMVRQAHHERKIGQLQSLKPFVLSLSKDERF